MGTRVTLLMECASRSTDHQNLDCGRRRGFICNDKTGMYARRCDQLMIVHLNPDAANLRRASVVLQQPCCQHIYRGEGAINGGVGWIAQKVA